MKQNDKLFNRNFIILSIASLLTFIAFYLMMPIIAMYVVDTFDADASTAGIVAAAYIITALITRPFSGYLVDQFDRRKFYLLVLAMFATLFIGYVISNSITQLIITRIFLGAGFSLVTTAANTLTIDVIPSSRRAEGIGYYGAIIVFAMAIGPMLGLYMIDVFSYKNLFIFATICAWAGVITALFVKTKPRKPVAHEPLSVDRFFLRDGLSMASVIALLYFLYGTLMVYVSLYVRECGLQINSGNFFMLFACGIIISRMLSARLLRNGKHNEILVSGIMIIIAAGALFTLYLTNITLPISSILLGLGFGFVAPAIQAMIVDLVPARRRGTANSTYFIALDLGSGLGMLVGGTIAHLWDYRTLYIIGIGLAIVSLVFYLLYARKDYDKRQNAANKEE